VLDISIPLAESMDQSIGEATTLMSAVISEVVRRSLRGGVLRIGEELQTFVTGEVDTALAERVPEVERAAVEVAEQTAQVAAAKVAAEEVHALDVKTGAVTQKLAAQIEEVERDTRGIVEEKAQALAGQIQDVDRRAVESAEQLSGKIVEAEQRACEKTRAETEERLNKLLEKAREATTALKTRLKTVEELAEGLGSDLRQEQASRQGEMQAGFAKVQQGLDQLNESLTRGLEMHQARLKEEASALRKAHEDLAARVAALEKPKGLFARLFGKRKDKGEAGA
jgi:uncharacterized phage infection (PIP) family protein YhgE